MSEPTPTLNEHDIQWEMYHAPHYQRVNAGTIAEYWVKGPSYAERDEAEARRKADGKAHK